MIVLAGDIGGTNTRLALYETPRGDGDDPPSTAPLIERTYPSASSPTLDAIAERFLAEARQALPRQAAPTRACLGIAGPVDGNVCRATNLPWTADGKLLSQRLGIERVRLVNDFFAAALGSIAVSPRDLAPLGGGPRDSKGPVAVVGAGTGLGQAFLLWSPAENRYQVVPSEGGHVDFAPRTPLEAELLRFLSAKYGRVSYERVLSGNGLVDLYAFLNEEAAFRALIRPETAAAMAAGDPAAVITQRAMQREDADPVCTAALTLFAGVLGALAGNLALNVLATGGVFVAGGIAPRIRSFLERGVFREAFERKGRLQPLVARIPAFVVMHPQPGLLGAAAVAATMARAPGAAARTRPDAARGPGVLAGFPPTENCWNADEFFVVNTHRGAGAALALGDESPSFSEERNARTERERERFGRMVGQSVPMRAVFETLARAAPSDATVLLEGETGTGKEITAEAIHRGSRRRDKPFLVVDCGAIPPQLLESELFGHERGSFTGAVSSRQGVFEAAAGGTVFLDEIGELSIDLQPKLLRVLERREVRRIGTNQHVPVNVRLIAATNRGLREQVAARKFRSDLYYRLAVVELRLPPLRERLSDLPLLVEHIARTLGPLDADVMRIIQSGEFLAKLARHDWPGNIRELRNHLERCVALTDFSAPHPSASASAMPTPESAAGIGRPLREAREEWVNTFEKRYLEELLRVNDNRVSVAARSAGVDRIYFYRLLWKHGLRTRESTVRDDEAT